MRTFTLRAWRHALTTLLFIATASAAAQEGGHLNPYAVLTSAEQVAEVINQAHTEILLGSPNLRSQAIAEALRVAMLERGVDVFILTDVKGANEESSYFHALHLAGAHTRIFTIPQPGLIVDRAYYITGGLLKPTPMLGQTMEATMMITDPDVVQQMSNGFVQLYADAYTFEYSLDGDGQ